MKPKKMYLMGAQNKVLTHYINLPRFCSLRLLSRRSAADVPVPAVAAVLGGGPACGTCLGPFILLPPDLKLPFHCPLSEGERRLSLARLERKKKSNLWLPRGSWGWPLIGKAEDVELRRGFHDELCTLPPNYHTGSRHLYKGLHP